VLVKTFGDVIADYRTHPEAKSAGPDGQPYNRDTRGLLRRRHVTPDRHIRAIGKEAHGLEDREADLVADPDELLTEYVEPARDDFTERVLPVIRERQVSEIAEATGLSERTIKRVRAGKRRPHAATIAKLKAYAVGCVGQHAVVAMGVVRRLPPMSDAESRTTVAGRRMY
jgi:hypothetical protein